MKHLFVKGPFGLSISIHFGHFISKISNGVQSQLTPPSYSTNIMFVTRKEQLRHLLQKISKKYEKMQQN